MKRFTLRLLRGDWFAGPIRLAEWVSALWALNYARVLIKHPHLFQSSHAYDTLASWTDEQHWALLFIVLAALHLALTIAPGLNIWPRRAVCLLGIAIWGAVTTGVLHAADVQGVIYTATITAWLSYTATMMR